MITDVTRTWARSARAVVIGAAILISASLCWSYLHAADSGDTEDQVAAILKIVADPEYGEYLAGECLTCHGATGSDNNIPGIHGREIPFIVTALVEYKNKVRENEVMRSVAGALGNDEIAAIAAYFSKQPR